MLILFVDVSVGAFGVIQRAPQRHVSRLDLLRMQDDSRSKHSSVFIKRFVVDAPLLRSHFRLSVCLSVRLSVRLSVCNALELSADRELFVESPHITWIWLGCEKKQHENIGSHFAPGLLWRRRYEKRNSASGEISDFGPFLGSAIYRVCETVRISTVDMTKLRFWYLVIGQLRFWYLVIGQAFSHLRQNLFRYRNEKNDFIEAVYQTWVDAQRRCVHSTLPLTKFLGPRYFFMTCNVDYSLSVIWRKCLFCLHHCKISWFCQ